MKPLGSAGFDGGASPSIIKRRPCWRAGEQRQTSLPRGAHGSAFLRRSASPKSSLARWLGSLARSRSGTLAHFYLLRLLFIFALAPPPPTASPSQAQTQRRRTRRPGNLSAWPIPMAPTRPARLLAKMLATHMLLTQLGAPQPPSLSTQAPCGPALRPQIYCRLTLGAERQGDNEPSVGSFVPTFGALSAPG